MKQIRIIGRKKRIHTEIACTKICRRGTEGLFVSYIAFASAALVGHDMHLVQRIHFNLGFRSRRVSSRRTTAEKSLKHHSTTTSFTTVERVFMAIGMAMAPNYCEL